MRIPASPRRRWGPGVHFVHGTGGGITSVRFWFRSETWPWDSGVGVGCGEGARTTDLPREVLASPTLQSEAPHPRSQVSLLLHLQLLSLLSVSLVSSSFNPSVCLYFSPSCNLSASLPSFSSLFLRTLTVSLFRTFCLSLQCLCSSPSVSLFLLSQSLSLSFPFLFFPLPVTVLALVSLSASPFISKFLSPSHLSSLNFCDLLWFCLYLTFHVCLSYMWSFSGPPKVKSFHPWTG